MGVFGKTETGRVVVQDGGGGSSEDGGWKARRAGAEIKDIFASGHDVSFELGYIRIVLGELFLYTWRVGF